MRDPASIHVSAAPEGFTAKEETLSVISEKIEHIIPVGGESLREEIIPFLISRTASWRDRNLTGGDRLVGSRFLDDLRLRTIRRVDCGRRFKDPISARV